MLLLLFISVVSAALCSIILHIAPLGGRSAIFRFNALSTTVWCIILFCLNGFCVRLDGIDVFWGVLYGIIQACFILSKTAAMSSGSVSVTTLIGNCSLLVSVIFSYFLFGEEITATDLVGIILLLLGLGLSAYRGEQIKLSKKWGAYAALFLLLGAGVGLSFKGFSKSGSSDAGNMMLIASIVMLGLYSVFSVLIKEGDKETRDRGKRGLFTVTALISGALGCLYNRLNIYLSGELDAVIFFPLFNGGVVILSGVLSILLLRERLSKRQVLGLIFGVIGISIIGIFK